MAYTVDDTRFPLVLVRATEFSDPSAALELGYRKLEQILGREQAFVIVFDMRGASSSPGRRRRLIDWCVAHEQALTRYLVGGAVVARSSIERGFHTATLWLRTPPFPVRLFADVADAEAWLRADFARLFPR